MQPSLETPRLLLRLFQLDDADSLQRLAGEREIVDTMISIPHPYSRDDAEQWIAGHAEASAQGTALHFAVTAKESGELIGSVELRDIDTEHAQAELSFWIGKPCWGRGYVTEATRPVVTYGFQ